MDRLVERRQSRNGGGLESGDDGGPREQMGVRDVGPGGDFEGAAGILRLESTCPIQINSLYDHELDPNMGQRTPNISKFSIFEQQKLLAPRYLVQAFDCPLGEVVDDVYMSFQNADGVAHLLC